MVVGRGSAETMGVGGWVVGRWREVSARASYVFPWLKKVRSYYGKCSFLFDVSCASLCHTSVTESTFK